jgi:hypothetical protein
MKKEGEEISDDLGREQLQGLYHIINKIKLNSGPCFASYKYNNI